MANMYLTIEQVAYLESLNHLPPGKTKSLAGRDYRIVMPVHEFRRMRDMHLNLGVTGHGTQVPLSEHLSYSERLHTYLLNMYCSPPRIRKKS